MERNFPAQALFSSSGPRHISNMISALLLFALFVNASGQCGDDMVPIVVTAGKLPAEWNIGTIPHVFLNSEHMRGVINPRDWKISGLDTVVGALGFCPLDMTIYGDLSASRIQVTGHYISNYDYLMKGAQVFTHGQGVVNITTSFQLRNLVAPLRYSRVVKKLQIDSMKYDATDEVFSPVVTGLHVDGEGEHDAQADEFTQIDKSNGCPTLVEFVRGVINQRAKDGILLGAVREMFQSVLSF